MSNMALSQIVTSPTILRLLLLLLPLAVLEAVLSVAGLLGHGALRTEAIRHLAVWPELWGGAQGLYPAQGTLMMVSYSLLHADGMHFAFNAVMILIFGRLLLGDMRMREFVAVFFATAAAGALFYIILSTETTPVVGASGGAYGLAGLWAAQFMRRRALETGSWQPVIGVLGAMAAVTLLMPVGATGVAWQAHLGGAVLGLIWGWVRESRRGGSTPPGHQKPARFRVVK